MFLNPAEFGESVTLERQNARRRGGQAGNRHGPKRTTGPRFPQARGAVRGPVRFPDELYPGTSVTFNGERWFVATADREALRTIRLYREAA